MNKQDRALIVVQESIRLLNAQIDSLVNSRDNLNDSIEELSAELRELEQERQKIVEGRGTQNGDS